MDAVIFYGYRRIKIERAHQSATTQASQKESGERCRTDYRARLCASFDTYLAAGLDRKEAFKRVAAHSVKTRAPSVLAVKRARNERARCGHFVKDLRFRRR